MAVDILQQPTTPNVTGTNLVYTLSSSNASNPQFRYVTDIYESGSGDYVTTIKTFPNLSGNGILDVARTLDDQLDYDLYWKTTGSIEYVENVKTFDIRFGEEYAPSISGSITTYTGSTPNYLEVFPGKVYKNEGSYNFNTSSLLPGLLSGSQQLTNNPAMLYPDSFITPGVFEYGDIFITKDSYYTVDLFIDTPSSGSNSGFLVNGFDFGTSSLSLVLSTSITASNLPFENFGVGPANMSDYSTAWSSSIADGTIKCIVPIGTLGGPRFWLVDNITEYPDYLFNQGYQTFFSINRPPVCVQESTHFAFVNSYGFWDYYTIFNPLRSDNQVDRSIYERSFVRYEDSIGSYNISNRGNTQYRTEYDKRYIITTDFIDKETSQWLTELFESPEVFIQQNGDFVPINITNTTIRWNMNQYREKLFQYDIEFKYANQPQPR